MRSQNYPLADENFQKAISTDPEFTPAYKELGEMYYSMKDGEKAAKAYESYLKLKENPNDQDKTRYAFFLFMAKNYVKANETFKPLAAKTDASCTTLKYYGYSLVESGDLAEAQRIFEKYFTCIPKDKLEATDYSYYGKLLQKLNKDSLAIISYQESLTLNPEQEDIALLRAEALLKAKRFQEASDAYLVLMKLRKKPMSLDYYGLGRAYYYNSQFEKADTTFQKLIEMQPARTIGYSWMCKVKTNQDPTSEKGLAKPYYEKIIEIGVVEPEKNKKDLIEAYSYLAKYYVNKDDLNSVKTYLKKILELDPNNQMAVDAMKELNKK
jgi:tetratricopeptide (TPR) repeat protein